ncbi:MAG TPA: rRNA adenine N-6-methyltransferase family protein [Candidatus Blautia faecavium]|uniref:rRNA adenine N-6-methyltransferase family protein n=1 Tax=Candidatus Blautia faecavium TaxID=2838487 RepID=A0A9D2RUV3_9FIRM|nr:rRNA adenine N-6-methyltransferase family protein [Candidatus Blautia faecavium]
MFTRPLLFSESNLLISEKVLNQIIKQLNLKETDTVYERRGFLL